MKPVLQKGRKGKTIASIREIAKKANVAPGTVSRTLNNKGYISKKTREKVEKALREMEYVPNELARNLFHNRSNMIGVILPDIEHPFFMSVIMNIVKALIPYSYHAVMWTTEYKAELEHTYLDMLKRNVVDGAIIAIPFLEDKAYQECGRPIVMLDKVIDGIPLVEVNHKKAGIMAANEFHKCGCRHVVVISGTKDLSIPSYQRELSFIERSRELGMDAQSYSLSWTNFHTDYAEQKAAEIFDRHPHLDGILTSDLFAAACYRHAKRIGRRIPEDLVIISTDGVYSNQYGIVSFSSVVQPSEEIGKRAARQILNLIGEQEAVSPEPPIEPYFEKGETT